ncbi:hypothetical protein BDV93DRAFT_524532, partial [Ceratobasidium sp. AG-I]
MGDMVYAASTTRSTRALRPHRTLHSTSAHVASPQRSKRYTQHQRLIRLMPPTRVKQYLARASKSSPCGV